jgi:hypothetical protein
LRATAPCGSTSDGAFFGRYIANTHTRPRIAPTQIAERSIWATAYLVVDGAEKIIRFMKEAFADHN